MSAGSRKGALIAGLILIAIGLVFLLDKSPWYLIGRYWPVILILIGIFKLYGYFTWQEVPPVSDARPKE